MAEQGKNQGGASKFINSPGKGMHTDTSAAAQPDDSYRWALNAINASATGDLGFLVNEEGNYECGEVGKDWAVIGHVYISDDEAVIFLAPVEGTTSSSIYGWGRLAYVKKDCTIKNLITANCLNFKITHQIQAIYRVRNGCERNIYWTDNLNDIRHINLDSLTDYLTEGKERFIAQNPTNYMDIVVDPADNVSIWDCERMKLWPDFDYACIEFVELNDGGGLAAGTYQFAVQYLDQDFNPTNWTDLTQPIPVYESPINATAMGIKGASPGSVNQDGSSATGFSVAGNQTNKSITLKFSNLDVSFSFLRVAVWPSTGGLGDNIEGGRMVAEIPITATEEFFTFGEYNPEVTEFLSRDEITIDRKVFNKAKTIEQIDGRLLLANLEEIEVDHAAFQRRANDMRITYTTRTLDADDAQGESVQSGKYYFDYRSYMRDEIYAFGIVWYFKDGTHTPVYHIPGRAQNTDSAGAALISSGDYNRPGQAGYTMGQHNRPAATSGWDTSVIVANAQTDSTDNMNTHHYENDNIYRNGDILRWEVYNTAIRTSAALISGEYITKGEMGYYECRDYKYPDTKDCQGVPIYPHTGTGTEADPYVMAQVRHHRMPDTTLEPHFYGNPQIGRMRTSTGCRPSDGRAWTGNTHGDNPFVANQEARISTIGIEVSNIQPPADLADRIQGYKIVKAVQNITDKTVLDKGIVYNTIIAANMWIGRKAPRVYPAQCAYQFQANCFNKHMYASACVHMTNKNAKVNSTEFATDPASFLDMGDDGSVTILCDDWYCHGFDETDYIHNGWVLNEDGLNTDGGGPHKRGLDCINCNSSEDDLNIMAPAIVSHGFYWEAAVDDDQYDRGKCFRSRRGMGYPIPWWGWGRNGGVQDLLGSDSSVSAGVNVGYFTSAIVYPNAVQSYHGPMAKFKSIPNAQYVKVERILLGYNYMIWTNNACCVNDSGQTTPFNTPTSSSYGIVGFGFGGIDGNRNDGYLTNTEDAGTTYIYQRMSYQQSVVPYSRIDTGIQDMYDRGDASHWEHCSDPLTADIFGWGDQNSQIWARDAMFNFDLTNIRLDDYIQLPAFQGDAFIPTMGDVPFRNYTQQEFMPLVCKTKPGGVTIKKPFAWPWPGNNTEATACPLDSAYTNNHEGDLDGIGTAYYVSLKKNSYNSYGAIGNITYNPTHNCVIPINQDLPLLVVNSGEVYGGNIFISRLAFKQTQEGGRCGMEVDKSNNDKCAEGGSSALWGVFGYDNKWWPSALGNAEKIDPAGGGGVAYRYALFNNISWYWTESEINCELRLGQDADGQRIYPYHYESAGAGFGPFSFVDEHGIHDMGTTHHESDTGNPSPNYYALNEDYHKINNENIYKPLPLQFDFCAECQERHPYRLTWSEKSFQEESKDLFKSFLTNNYRDFPAHRGEVWNMFVLNNAAFVHTAESLWRIDPSRQIVNPAEGERSVYIGTGAFFSNDPQEILQSKTGYLGCQSQWATLETESGVIWPDERQGHVFLMQESPKDLTNVGMKNWMENHMNIEIYDQYEMIYDTKFPFFDNPANPAGAGYVSVYDARYNRYIMTKRDYKLISPWDTADPNSPYYQVISADPYSGTWVVSGGNNANCNCAPNPLWSSNTNYLVTNTINSITGIEECVHTWDGSFVRDVITTVSPQADIWVFYDRTSTDPNSAIAAHDAIENWVQANNVPGGILANWGGSVYHVAMRSEQWVAWPRMAMGDDLEGHRNVNAYASYSGGFSDVKPPVGTVSTDAICVVIHDETEDKYHGNFNNGNYSSSEKTTIWNEDRDTYVAKYDTHIGNGGTCKNLLYPVCTSMNSVKEMFVLHAFSGMYGDGIADVPVSGGQPNVDGNSLQTGLSGTYTVDLSQSLTTNNPYRNDQDLTKKGWGGRWDRRSRLDFGTNLGDDLSLFLQSVTTVTPTTFTAHVTEILPCGYDQLFDDDDAICKTCGENSFNSPLSITLNDGNVVTVNGPNDIFKCEGWTISFHLGMNHWISFHSYMPHYYLGMRNYFYSGLNNDAQYIHRHGLNDTHTNYQTYYGCTHPHIIDFISNDSPLNVNIYDTFHFLTDASHYNLATGTYVDDRYITFDKVYLYNDYQITGQLQFNVKDTGIANMMQVSVQETTSSCILDRKERTWSFNNFRDMAIGRDTGVPLFTSSWANLLSEPYLDKVINPLAVNTGKSWLERQFLRDKYLGIRLFFSNLAGQTGAGSHKLVTTYMYGSAQQNNR